MIMGVKSIEVLNLMVFDSFKLDFCDGINVLIGENGVGKTTLLKMIYAASQSSIKQTDEGKTKRLLQFFSNSLNDSDALKNTGDKSGYCYYKVTDGEHSFEDSLSHSGVSRFDEWQELNIQSVFIPTTEMLSHSRGFLALNQKYHMPFDATQVDIIVNASLPETREISASMTGILEKISDVIDGTVIQEDDSFYVVKRDGRKIDFSLEAEGLRKLGLLWKLIRNGLLEKGTLLLWDEPETNLNPELYPLAAEILLELQKNGVQIFVATHSYNFAKYLEIRRTSERQVMFHNLYKGAAGISDERHNRTEVYSKSAYRMEDLGSNYMMSADGKLLDEVYHL